MENHKLLGMIENLPPDSRKKVEDLVGTLTVKNSAAKGPREFGALKGFVTYIADDFDAPMKEFHDYMYHISIEFIAKIEELPVEDQQEIEAIVDEKLAKIKSVQS